MKHPYLFLFALLNSVACAFGQIMPKKLLIYYSFPSSLNYPVNLYNLDNVANDFKQYDYVVLGESIETSEHPDHVNTVNILAKMAGSTTKVFGYIDLSTTIRNHSIATIQQKVNEWKAVGVQGIFFDDFGYDFNVSRTRQNTVVNYTHSQNLRVIANGWNPDDVFGSTVDPIWNPAGMATALNSQDFYLSESYLIKTYQYEPNPGEWKVKADKLRNYRQNIGFKILSITTGDSVNQLNYDADKFFYAWYGAAIDNHEATGWGEYKFACCGAINAKSPYRVRPSVTIGTAYNEEARQTGSEIFRYTNLGKIAINTATHAYSFIPYTTCMSTASGNWHAANTWSCGRVPFDYDHVVIRNPHKITLNQPAALTSCQQLMVERGAVFDCRTKFLARIRN